MEIQSPVECQLCCTPNPWWQWELHFTVKKSNMFHIWLRVNVKVVVSQIRCFFQQHLKNIPIWKTRKNLGFETLSARKTWSNCIIILILTLICIDDFFQIIRQKKTRRRKEIERILGHLPMIREDLGCSCYAVAGFWMSIWWFLLGDN